MAGKLAIRPFIGQHISSTQEYETKGAKKWGRDWEGRRRAGSGRGRPLVTRARTVAVEGIFRPADTQCLIKARISHAQTPKNRHPSAAAEPPARNPRTQYQRPELIVRGARDEGQGMSEGWGTSSFRDIGIPHRRTDKHCCLVMSRRAE